jgi:hypothetical protein
VQRQHVRRAELEQGPHAGSIGPPGPFDGVPRRKVRQVLPRHVGHDGWLLACAHEHVERPVGGLGEGLHRQDGVDEPVLEEVLGRLDALGEGPLVECLVDPGAEEPDHRSRLRHGDLPEGAPRREDTAGRGVTEVDEVRQPGRLELCTGRADLHHPDEGRRPLLHAGPPRGRRRKHRQLLTPGTFERHDDPLGRNRPDRPREEAELAGDDGHAALPDPALASDDGFVAPAALASGSQLSGIRRILRRGLRGGTVPAGPRTLVEDGVKQLAGP